MIIKNFLATTNPVFCKGDSFKELKGIIITSATMNNKINDFLDNLDVWGFLSKCPHYIIDNNGVIYQTLPVNYKGKYCGGIVDKGYIQIVVDEPIGIKYTTKNKFTVPDLKRAKGQETSIYKSLIELCSYLCITFKIDPIQENNIISQFEGHNRKLCSDYPGIDHIWNELNTEYTMIKLRRDVLNALHEGKGYYHDGIDYSFVFDPDYYGSAYPDVYQQTNGDKRELFTHFLTFGMKECKKGCGDFDILVYKTNNPDLDFGTDWSGYYRHYCEIGRFENRKHV